MTGGRYAFKQASKQASKHSITVSLPSEKTAGFNLIYFENNRCILSVKSG